MEVSERPADACLRAKRVRAGEERVRADEKRVRVREKRVGSREKRGRSHEKEGGVRLVERRDAPPKGLDVLEDAVVGFTVFVVLRL